MYSLPFEMSLAEVGKLDVHLKEAIAASDWEHMLKLSNVRMIYAIYSFARSRGLDQGAAVVTCRDIVAYGPSWDGVPL